MGPGDFGHVDVAAGVDADAMGSDEPAGFLPFRLVAQPSQNVALDVVDADPGT